MPRTGHLEVGASVTRRTGPEAWLEGQANLGHGLGAFVRGYARPDDAGVMGGVRYQFDW